MLTEDETEELMSGYYMYNGVLMNKSEEKVVPYGGSEGLLLGIYLTNQCDTQELIVEQGADPKLLASALRNWSQVIIWTMEY